MTVRELVTSLFLFKDIKEIIIHFIDGKECLVGDLILSEIYLEVTSFHWNNHECKLHVYVEEFK